MIDRGYILAALQKLAVTDTERQLFGSNGHDYALNPPLAEADLAAFERDAGVALPTDYRTFITKIGNGGAGPYYGVFRFGEHDDGHGFCSWEKGYLVGDFSQEFPHLEAWNLPPSFWDDEPSPPEGMPDAEADKLWAAWDAKLERDYWSTSLVKGAIPICHLGCATTPVAGGLRPLARPSLVRRPGRPWRSVSRYKHRGQAPHLRDLVHVVAGRCPEKVACCRTNVSGLLRQAGK